MKRLAVVGSRDYWNLGAVRDFVAKLKPDTIVVSGGARGVDMRAEETALATGHQILSFRPQRFEAMSGEFEWTIETVAAGLDAGDFAAERNYRINPPCFPSFAMAAFARNKWIVDAADGVAAFWDGSSPGTKHTIGLARKRGIWLRVYTE